MSFEQFDDQFDPFNTGRVANLEILPDGEYQFEVLAAVLDITPKTGTTLLRWRLKTSNGMVVEHTNFLTTQQNLNLLGADLLLLGIPTNTWTPANGKKFSVEFKKALPSLVGIRFAATKTSTKRDTATYHNLRIKGLAAGVKSMPNEEIF